MGADKYEEVPKGIRLIQGKQGPSTHQWNFSRDLNTNNPNSTADAEQVHGVKEVARLTCWPLLPLDKTEQWARWITESAGCN